MVTVMLSVMLNEGTKSVLWFCRDGKRYDINLNDLRYFISARMMPI